MLREINGLYLYFNTPFIQLLSKGKIKVELQALWNEIVVNVEIKLP